MPQVFYRLAERANIFAAGIVTVAISFMLWGGSAAISYIFSPQLAEAMPLTILPDATYKFSISYPIDAIVTNPSPDIIGINPPDRIAPAAYTALMTGDSRSTPSAHQALVLERLLALCAENAPVPCANAAVRIPIRSDSDVRGVKYFMNTADTVKGPFYALDISANAPAGTKFVTLIIYPPGTLAADDVDMEFLRALARSVTLDTPTK